MEGKDELKEIDIKNREYYYFDDIIKDIDINFSNNLLDEKLYETILLYYISYKTSTVPKQLPIAHASIKYLNRFIRSRGGEFRHLVLFDYRLFDKMCEKIKYLISEKSGITDSINHNFGKIRIDSYNSLPIEKTWTFHNVIILIRSVVNKNNYYCNIFLEKALYKDKPNTQYF